MIAKAARFSPEGDEEKRCGFGLSKQRVRIFALPEHARQVHIEVLDDRCCLQECDHPTGLTSQNFPDQEVDDKVFATRKGAYERRLIRRTLQ